jgi:hypothetical protein
VVIAVKAVASIVRMDMINEPIRLGSKRCDFGGESTSSLEKKKHCF